MLHQQGVTKYNQNSCNPGVHNGSHFNSSNFQDNLGN